MLFSLQYFFTVLFEKLVSWAMTSIDLSPVFSMYSFISFFEFHSNSPTLIFLPLSSSINSDKIIKIFSVTLLKFSLNQVKISNFPLSVPALRSKVLPLALYDLLFLKNVLRLSGAKTFLVRVPYFKRDWQVAFRKKLGIYYFSDNDHKIEHTLEELEKELGEANLVIKETITDWGEIWTKCEYDF